MASPVISAATDLFGGLSGGLAYGPGGVLFFNTFFFDRLGEIKPDSTHPDKVVELLFQGIGLAGGSIAFVPDRFNDAGKLLVGMWDTGKMCTANLTPGGAGTYDVSSCVHQTTAVGAGGLLGIAYAPPGSPDFGPSGGMLVSEVFDFTGQTSAYAVDANGLLIPGSHQTFVAGASGAGSMTTDPVTGDLLFSWGGGASQLVEVRGFTPGVTPVPEPAAWLLMVTGLGSLATLRRRMCR